MAQPMRPMGGSRPLQACTEGQSGVAGSSLASLHWMADLAAKECPAERAGNRVRLQYRSDLRFWWAGTGPNRRSCGFQPHRTIRTVGSRRDRTCSDGQPIRNSRCLTDPPPLGGMPTGNAQHVRLNVLRRSPWSRESGCRLLAARAFSVPHRGLVCEEPDHGHGHGVPWPPACGWRPTGPECTSCRIAGSRLTQSVTPGSAWDPHSPGGPGPRRRRPGPGGRPPCGCAGRARRGRPPATRPGAATAPPW